MIRRKRNENHYSLTQEKYHGDLPIFSTSRGFVQKGSQRMEHERGKEIYGMVTSKKGTEPFLSPVFIRISEVCYVFSLS